MELGNRFVDTHFNPARSIPEACARIFALTFSRDVGTRGPRRSLLALAGSLRLDVDSNAVNAIVGGQIAQVLDVGWSQPRDYVQYQVTLQGMNTLLRATAENLAQLSHAKTVADAQALEQVLAAFPGFRPAQGKQEAVNRMSDLAGVHRDKIGPGGKEHIETLQHLARRFAPHLLDVSQTKHSLVEGLCEALRVPWSPNAVSTQGTITKQGLNMILAGAERQANISSAAWATAADEGAALVNALMSRLDDHWDGRECVQWMRKSGSTQWRQMEWPGFYFEEKAREILNEAYPTPPVGGPRVKWGKTPFDYASPSRVWDAKAHTEKTVSIPRDGSAPRSGSRDAWLNDAQAVRDCVNAQGLGFLVLDGLAGFDTTGAFKAWHKKYGLSGGQPLSGYVSSTGVSRKRKSEFSPMTLRALWIQDIPSLDAGIAAGWIYQTGQPDWGAGEVRRSRNDKFKAVPKKAGLPWQVASNDWPSPL